jgi:class 3 adenylate cyclase/tetratricopeptide (TPR) repeat protein
MKCPKCQFQNKEEARFCRKCGAKLELACPSCGHPYEDESFFCEQCGQKLDGFVGAEKEETKAEGERKHVTVLFSDLSGYTTMSEKLDPEELKGITTSIFNQASKIIAKYEGFVEKFVGDAVMALFGVPAAHEDDPVRAIRAAREIHEFVEGMSSGVEAKIRRPLSMHSGINTGLVVTGEVNVEKGTHGVAGDTINVASRLSSLAGKGQILIGPQTYRRAEGYFEFEKLEPTEVKGKAEPIQVYRVLSPKERPDKVHRLSGFRAELIGRKAEMDHLTQAVTRLRDGKGSIISICGPAGTGKSRLVEEFKATLNLEEIQWLEGNAYAYSQNIPYFPMVDLLNRAFKIKEGNLPAEVREKIESSIAELVGKGGEVATYLGSLYSLSYPEADNVSPETLKSRLQQSLRAIITALAEKSPTVFFLEDLHWADPSSVELFRSCLLEIGTPAIVLCAYRPPFSLFENQQLVSVGRIYHEILLQDLSLSDSQDMLESLLRTDAIPYELKTFVQEKSEGNPFYLEELVNSLIDSDALVNDNGTWTLTKSISDLEISSTINGVISSRLDRLEREKKRILQEASVIGRAFLCEILKRVTEVRNDIDFYLRDLEYIGLIRTKEFEPHLEYVFKHVLTQEVAYNGLLKKDRKEIHEKIGLVVEQLFHDRLPEFYEALAFHFKRGQSINKAVEYLMKSGEKSLARYSVEEAHQYFKEAFDILAAKSDKSHAENVALIDILNNWGYAYYYLGDFSEFIDHFNSHAGLAEALKDKARLGMFYAWLGIAYYMGGKPRISYDYLSKALTLGEGTGSKKVMGYACTWLTWACVELGLLDEAEKYGEKAQQVARLFPSDQYLYFKSLAGLVYLRFLKGDIQGALDGGKALLAYGESTSNSRSKVFAHFMTSVTHIFSGDSQSIKKSGKKAIEASEDPLYSIFGTFGFGVGSFLCGEYKEAENLLQSMVDFSEKRGEGQCLVWAYLFLGPAMIANGHMDQGLKVLKKGQHAIVENQRKGLEAVSEYVLGKVYSQIATGPKPSFSIMVKNLGRLFLNSCPKTGFELRYMV